MPSSSSKPRLRRRFVAAARVAACTAAASIALGVCGVGHVSATLEQSSLSLGARLATQLGDLVTDPQPIHVNGQQLWIASNRTDLSVTQALDRFDAHCLDGTHALATSLRPLENQPAATEARKAFSAAQRTLIRRDEIPGRGGQLVCLAPTEPLHGFIDLAHRLQALLTTGDLTPLGELRYVHARPRPEGGSHLITIWTAGPFNLLQALPQDTDVPGTDPQRAPRPPHSTRILSASLPARAYSITTYLTQHTPPELLAFYDREMPKQGWTPLDADHLAPETAPLSSLAHAYTQANAVTFVVADNIAPFEAPNTPRATATLVQIGAPGTTIPNPKFETP